MIQNIDEWMVWVVAVWGGLTVIALVARKAWKTGTAAAAKVNSAVDTLVGREAVTHPETGDELVPATPGLGVRLAHMEHAIASLADSHAQMTALSSRVESLALRFDQHIVESVANDHARSGEQKAMWKAIEAIAKAPAAE